jgi:multiple sugar transport system permease protein
MRWFLAPVAVGAAVLVVVPAALTLAMAFTAYDALSAPEWVGLANFERMFDDPIFRQALGNSLWFIAIAVPLRLLVALAVGLLVSRPRRGVGAVRTAVTLPTFVPEIAWALLWVWALNPIYGPFAALLGALGLPGDEMLVSARGAQAAIVLMGLFQVAEAIVVVAAVRSEIPEEHYEAAALEGASPWFTFRRLTLPLLAPVLALLAARDVALSFQAGFVPALIVTDGGPIYATTFLPLHTYRTAFEFLRFGEAAAMTVVMFAITAATIGAMLLALRRWRVAVSA